MLSGKFRGKPIKIYEAKNSDHSAFIEKISTNSQLLDCFQKFILCAAGLFLQTGL